MGMRYLRGETVPVSAFSAIALDQTPRYKVEQRNGTTWTSVVAFADMTGSLPEWNAFWTIPTDAALGEYRIIVETVLGLTELAAEMFVVEADPLVAENIDIQGPVHSELLPVLSELTDLKRRALDPIALLEELRAKVNGRVSLMRFNDPLTVSNEEYVVTAPSFIDAFGYASALCTWNISLGQDQFVEGLLPYSLNLSAFSQLEVMLVSQAAGTFLTIELRNNGVWTVVGAFTVPDGQQNKDVRATVDMTSIQRDKVDGFRFVLDGTLLDFSEVPGYQDWFSAGHTHVSVAIDKLEAVVPTSAALPDLSALQDSLTASLAGLATQSTLDNVARHWQRSYDVLRRVADYALTRVFIDDFDRTWESSDVDNVMSALVSGRMYQGGTAVHMVIDLVNGVGADKHVQLDLDAGNEVDLSFCNLVELRLNSDVASVDALELGVSENGTDWSYVSVAYPDGSQNRLTDVRFDISGVVSRSAIRHLRLRLAHGNVDVNSVPGDQWPWEHGVTHANLYFDRLEGIVDLSSVPGGDWG